ncbi:MAG: NAD-dependent epimerase/dehydratase family protein [Alphaproteobacteria bacterium]|nr:MAG: NAD-dependent epimerase/dehydratase family protein [Alphaproteobacteria bacterium]
MAILVTGAAGFIGFHVAHALLRRGDSVIGVDNLNDYYSVKLKRDRLARLQDMDGFAFVKVDLANSGAVNAALAGQAIDRIVHLAAQAGVRYSLEHPHAYLDANVTGHLNVLELARRLPRCVHLVYASSSSVYGGNTKLPFAETDRVDTPVSLYAATKKADELISQCYSHLYRLPQTGLRFFTVYGPWGRPDMAMWQFTDAIIKDRPITVFNHGDMRRDFTYIDDIVAGVLGCLDCPPADDGRDHMPGSSAPHRVFNIGNNRAEPLLRMIAVLEEAIGKKAIKQMAPMQPGDVKETYADIAAIQGAVGYAPTTPIDAGVPAFVTWFKSYHGLN